MKKEFSKLSERQQKILRFMQNFMDEEGYPPTIREIGENTDINSTSVVNYNLNKLVEAGYLERTDKVSRGLRLVTAVPGNRKKKVVTATNISQVPLVGHIAAGQPIQLPDDAGQYYDDDDMIDIPASMLGNNDPTEVFALTVRGDSMIDAMIAEGDVVILRQQQTANNGDMVAVWLPNDSETTLKYFYKEGSRVRLQPAHPTMAPIYVDATNCEVRGKVLSVIRRLH
ncbi:transcriptional repressor LexA [Phototrophicus methaneseepsis]|uniref:LexA repressor n=1 Tax=Phototrophicus methaneseepsis TaxID=2710758 RepID=A0A7S8IG64_9CHLR|nr:transcriptional repressor LexA [Phototrophicus methaneseepsis]QPC84376.1 transcriptional repressor LexA [Phototrophicus methaneseepsis]